MEIKSKVKIFCKNVSNDSAPFSPILLFFKSNIKNVRFLRRINAEESDDAPYSQILLLVRFK